MKKTAIILLVLIISLSSVFAVDSAFPDNPELECTVEKSVYRPRFATRFNTLAYRIWDNPAELAGGKFIFDLPEIGISVNNVAANLTNPKFLSLLNSDTTNMDMPEMIRVLNGYFGAFGTGSNTTNEMFRMDMGLGLEISGFALRTDLGISLNTYNASGLTTMTSVKIVPEVNAALSLGFGFKIIDTDNLTVKAGAAVHPSVKTFTTGIGATDLIGKLSDPDALDTEDPEALASLLGGDMYVGVAVPFDLSASVGFFKDRLKVYAKANNILGTYRFVKGDLNEISGLASDYQKIIKSEQTFGTAPVEIDLGFTAETNFIGIHPVVYAEFNNAYAYFKNMSETEVFTWTDLLAQFNFGAEVSLFKVVKLGFGYEDGYRQIAAGVGINDICVQAKYGAHKYNNNATDTLSVVVKFGWDANK